MNAGLKNFFTGYTQNQKAKSIPTFTKLNYLSIFKYIP